MKGCCSDWVAAKEYKRSYRNIVPWYFDIKVLKATLQNPYINPITPYVWYGAIPEHQATWYGPRNKN